MNPLKKTTQYIHVSIDNLLWLYSKHKYINPADNPAQFHNKERVFAVHKAFPALCNLEITVYWHILPVCNSATPPFFLLRTTCGGCTHSYHYLILESMVTYKDKWLRQLPHPPKTFPFIQSLCFEWIKMHLSEHATSVKIYLSAWKQFAETSTPSHREAHSREVQQNYRVQSSGNHSHFFFYCTPLLLHCGWWMLSSCTNCLFTVQSQGVHF